MKREEWVVGEHGIRPAGPPDHCFYCGEPLGHTHDEECVIRSRTIVVKASAEIVISVPECFTQEQIDRAYSHSQMIFSLEHLLKQLRERQDFILAQVKMSYVREATPQDEQWGQLYVEELPS